MSNGIVLPRHRKILDKVKEEIARQKRGKDMIEPKWIVNDLGELGVKVGGRFFFLYKGDNIEYDGIHDDGSPMLYRPVGKREFGETVMPMKWIREGKTQNRYTQELEYREGLSFGDPADHDWRHLPPKPLNP